MNVRPLHIGPLLVDPPLLQGPMAGFTNYAYRQVIRRFGGVGLPATEMVSAAAFRTSTPATAVSPIASGASPTNPARWPCRFGTTTRHAGRRGKTSGRRVPRQRRRYQLRLPGARCFRKGQKRLVSIPLSRSYRRNCRPRSSSMSARAGDGQDPLGATRDTINAIDVAQAIESAGGAR